MKKLKLVIFLLLGLALCSCSAITVVDAWKSPEVESFKQNNILVVARTENPEARKAFELEIADKLKARGFKATPSYIKFPEFLPNDKPTDDKKDQIRNMLQKEGFDGVVLSILKDYQERTRSITMGGYEASVNYGYTDWPNYVGGGFYTYYYHPLSYSTEYLDVEKTEYVMTSKLYVLETVAYDLNRPDKEQLLALVNAEVENPSTAESLAPKYAAAIAKRLKKTKPTATRN